MFRCHSKVFVSGILLPRNSNLRIAWREEREREREKKNETLQNGEEQTKNTYIWWNVVARESYVLVQYTGPTTGNRVKSRVKGETRFESFIISEKVLRMILHTTILSAYGRSLEGLCHEDIAVLGQFCAEIIL